MQYDLWDRVVSLTIGEAEPIEDDLHIEFRVQQSDGSEPNTASISVYNLSESTFKQMSSKGLRVTLSAGHSGVASLLFAGHVRSSQRERSGCDIKCTFECGDGDYAYTQASTNVTHKKGVMYSDVLKQLGSTIPNVDSVKVDIDDKPIPRALTLVGDTSAKMSQVCKTVGASWYITNGTLFVVSQTKELPDIMDISSESGLLGIPKKEEDGTMSFDCILQPSLSPGMRVQIDSSDTSGLFVVKQVTHEGSNYSNDFYSKVEKASAR